MKFLPWFLILILCLSNVVSVLNTFDANDRFLRTSKMLDDTMAAGKKMEDALDNLMRANDNLQAADDRLKTSCFGGKSK